MSQFPVKGADGIWRSQPYTEGLEIGGDLLRKSTVHKKKINCSSCGTVLRSSNPNREKEKKLRLCSPCDERRLKNLMETNPDAIPVIPAWVENTRRKKRRRR